MEQFFAKLKTVAKVHIFFCPSYRCIIKKLKKQRNIRKIMFNRNQNTGFNYSLTPAIFALQG